jgi:hypothetical protein
MDGACALPTQAAWRWSHTAASEFRPGAIVNVIPGIGAGCRVWQVFALPGGWV